MPILDVEVVGPVPDPIRQGLAKRLADAVGEVLDSRPQGTWVKLRYLDAEAYAENAGGPPEGVLPVFVSILQAKRPEQEQLNGLAPRLAAAIAGACDRPMDYVHIVFEPPALGRIAFGGRLRV